MLNHKSLGTYQALSHAQNQGKYYGTAPQARSHSLLVTTGSNQPVLQAGVEVFSIEAYVSVPDTEVLRVKIGRTLTH